VRTVELIAPVYGGINLEDIAAPRCFEVGAAGCGPASDIPVFHDDQHGNGDRRAGRADQRAEGRSASRLDEVRVVLSGVGAAGTAIIRLLLNVGVGDVLAVDRAGTPAPRGSTGLGRVVALGRRSTPTATGVPAGCARRWSAPTCSSA
jgi:malate dehydrogenase (oxaloacetate-decarboxylating)